MSVDSEMEAIKYFVRHEHPLRLANLLAAVALGLLLLVGLALLTPRADAESVRDGLTIVAEILGVLLGVILVAVVRLMEQGVRAEELMRGAHQKYRDLIEANLSAIDSGRRQLIEHIAAGRIAPEDPVYIAEEDYLPSSKKFRDVVAGLSTLVAMFSNMDSLPVALSLGRGLEQLGFSSEEIADVVSSRVEANAFPHVFLELVRDAVDSLCLGPHCSDEVGDVAMQVTYGYARDSLDEALRQHERSSRILTSKALATTIVVTLLTAVLSVLGIFGITDTTVYLPFYGHLVVAVVVGFVLSVVLVLALVGKMMP